MTETSPDQTVPDAPVIDKDNWQDADNVRWSFQHVDQVLPTTPISRGTGPVAQLPADLQDLGSVEVPKTEFSEARSVRSVIEASDTDAWLVMHNGTVLTEEYFSTMGPGTEHLLMSVSKSLVGTVAGVLAGAGDLDPSRLVTEYVPELAASGYAGATIRHILDMRSGIKFSENYLDPQSEVRQIEEAIGWSETKPAGQPTGMYDFLTTLEAKSEHGGVYEYRSCETDVLGWVCEKIAGESMQTLMSRVLWSRIGAERDALIATDQYGVGMFDGGINTTLRDLARFGYLYSNRGVSLTGEQVVPTSWVGDTLTGDADIRQAFADGPDDNRMPGGMYHNQFWFPFPDSHAFLALGIHGQMIYMNPGANFVGVKLSSWGLPQDARKLFPTIRAFDALAKSVSTPVVD
ncbi:MAG: serine hydrolase domain-containing protein [Brevibacterium aurantiacum]|uniref:Hydrolase n=1 Tax=Brevibacterium aurantiacum TaxID=273384 RepID=A0A2A3ZN03_BREAU|nr:serine hydrolase [Brevibacterium aurantiacum]PCC52989.1 hydrolase [Brevibacterium aurantiacum]RCS96098.1 class C beta-lactamase-related serine hydrolase [Brevibacterium aurantiacum]